MSINDNRNGVTPDQAIQAPQVTAEAPQQSARPSFQPEANMFAALTPLGRNPAGDTLNSLTKALNDIFEKQTGRGHKVTLVPIDHNNTQNICVSVVVVVVQDLARPKAGAGFHTLIVEGSIDSIPSRYLQIAGNNVEDLRFAGDAYDPVMIQTIGNVLAQQFPGVNMYSADACVVPREFDVTDVRRVYALAMNAGMAAATSLGIRNPDFQDVTMDMLRGGKMLQLRPLFNSPQLENATALPVRADVTLELAETRLRGRDDSSRSLNESLEQATPLTRVAGFMDLAYLPPAQMNNVYYQQQVQQQQFQQPQSMQRYVPRFVITNLENMNVMTLPAQLLALITAYSLQENSAWISAFRPKPFSKGQVDMHDIGALNIEANIYNDPNGGSRIDTSSEAFRPENLGQLLAVLVRNELVISIDVSECGPDTWCNSPFIMASEGNQKAVQAIVNAANVLTNGEFGKVYQSMGAGPLFINESTRIHMGYYVDAAGQKRDIRDIDYLAVTNKVGEHDLNVVRDWSDSFLAVAFPEAQRLAGRRRIIEGIVNQSATFTGMARRVTPTKIFLDALIIASKSAGLDIRPAASSQETTMYERATADFLSGAMLSGTTSGLFNRSFGPTAVPGMQGAGYRNW